MLQKLKLALRKLKFSIRMGLSTSLGKKCYIFGRKNAMLLLCNQHFSKKISEIIKEKVLFVASFRFQCFQNWNHSFDFKILNLMNNSPEIFFEQFNVRKLWSFHNSSLFLFSSFCIWFRIVPARKFFKYVASINIIQSVL